MNSNNCFKFCDGTSSNESHRICPHGTVQVDLSKNNPKTDGIFGQTQHVESREHQLGTFTTPNYDRESSIGNGNQVAFPRFIQQRKISHKEHVQEPYKESTSSTLLYPTVESTEAKINVVNNDVGTAQNATISINHPSHVIGTPHEPFAKPKSWNNMQSMMNYQQTQNVVSPTSMASVNSVEEKKVNVVESSARIEKITQQQSSVNVVQHIWDILATPASHNGTQPKHILCNTPKENENSMEKYGSTNIIFNAAETLRKIRSTSNPSRESQSAIHLHHKPQRINHFLPSTAANPGLTPQQGTVPISHIANTTTLNQFTTNSVQKMIETNVPIKDKPFPPAGHHSQFITLLKHDPGTLHLPNPHPASTTKSTNGHRNHSSNMYGQGHFDTAKHQIPAFYASQPSPHIPWDAGDPKLQLTHGCHSRIQGNSSKSYYHPPPAAKIDSVGAPDISDGSKWRQGSYHHENISFWPSSSLTAFKEKAPPNYNSLILKPPSEAKQSQVQMGDIIRPVKTTMCATQKPHCPMNRRKIGRVKRYDETIRSYGPWEDIYTTNSNLPLNLNRGGVVNFYSQMISVERRKQLADVMHKSKLFRQYSFSKVYHEPRSHVLLSSRIRSNTGIRSTDSSLEVCGNELAANNFEQSGPGYSYHGIKMKALPMDLVPEVECYAKELATRYHLPNNQWNIGCDLIAYKDGDDSIGWHADDTQGESLVLCVVVEFPGREPRTLRIRPNKKFRKLSRGDEQIELFPGEGDAYDMDGVMQEGYEHCLPKKKNDSCHRLVLIFRHGNVANVHEDSGIPLTEMAKAPTSQNSAKRDQLLQSASLEKEWEIVNAMRNLRVKLPTVIFGHPKSDVAEGEDCLSRRFLYLSSAHRSDQRGVNGNVKIGCDSIVVSRQSRLHREEDGLDWLMYTSSRKQGGGGLCLNYCHQIPLRVFRSSKLNGPFAPPPREKYLTSYRYDGLYSVTKIWDADGNQTSFDIPAGGTEYTFFLERLPKGEGQNSIGVEDLWEKIKLSHEKETGLSSQFLKLSTVSKPKPNCNTLPPIEKKDQHKRLELCGASKNSCSSATNRWGENDCSLSRGAKLRVFEPIPRRNQSHLWQEQHIQQTFVPISARAANSFAVLQSPVAGHEPWPTSYNQHPIRNNVSIALPLDGMKNYERHNNSSLHSGQPVLISRTKGLHPTLAFGNSQSNHNNSQIAMRNEGVSATKWQGPPATATSSSSAFSNDCEAMPRAKQSRHRYSSSSYNNFRHSNSLKLNQSNDRSDWQLSLTLQSNMNETSKCCPTYNSFCLSPIIPPIRHKGLASPESVRHSEKRNTMCNDKIKKRYRSGYQFALGDLMHADMNIAKLNEEKCCSILYVAFGSFFKKSNQTSGKLRAYLEEAMDDEVKSKKFWRDIGKELNNQLVRPGEREECRKTNPFVGTIKPSVSSCKSLEPDVRRSQSTTQKERPMQQTSFFLSAHVATKACAAVLHLKSTNEVVDEPYNTDPTQNDCFNSAPTTLKRGNEQQHTIGGYKKSTMHAIAPLWQNGNQIASKMSLSLKKKSAKWRIRSAATRCIYSRQQDQKYYDFSYSSWLPQFHHNSSKLLPLIPPIRSRTNCTSSEGTIPKKQMSHVKEQRAASDESIKEGYRATYIQAMSDLIRTDFDVEKARLSKEECCSILFVAFGVFLKKWKQKLGQLRANLKEAIDRLEWEEQMELLPVSCLSPKRDIRGSSRFRVRIGRSANCEVDSFFSCSIQRIRREFANKSEKNDAQELTSSKEDRKPRRKMKPNKKSPQLKQISPGGKKNKEVAKAIERTSVTQHCKNFKSVPKRKLPTSSVVDSKTSKRKDIVKGSNTSMPKSVPNPQKRKRRFSSSNDLQSTIKTSMTIRNQPTSNKKVPTEGKSRKQSSKDDLLLLKKARLSLRKQNKRISTGGKNNEEVVKAIGRTSRIKHCKIFKSVSKRKLPTSSVADFKTAKRKNIACKAGKRIKSSHFKGSSVSIPKPVPNPQKRKGRFSSPNDLQSAIKKSKTIHSQPTSNKTNPTKRKSRKPSSKDDLLLLNKARLSVRNQNGTQNNSETIDNFENEVIPKFISVKISNEEFIGLHPPLVAFLSVDETRNNVMKVTVKFDVNNHLQTSGSVECRPCIGKEEIASKMLPNDTGLTLSSVNVTEKISCAKENQSNKKIEKSAVEEQSQFSEKRRKVSRRHTYKVGEPIYAWDRKVLYKAKVLKTKETSSCNPEMEYHVHFHGYGKSHERWLPPDKMLKMNPVNNEKFRRHRIELEKTRSKRPRYSSFDKIC